MHMRVAKLTLGAAAAGDADALVSRISSDLVGAYSASEGFIGYYNVAADPSTAYTVRVFADQTTLDTANTALSAEQSVIMTDFDLTVDAVVAADVGAGAAYALTQVP